MVHAMTDDALPRASAPQEDELIDLVRKAQAGAPGALNDLLGRFQEELYWIVRIRLGARLRGVLESADVVQDACVVIHDKLPQFECRDRASTLRWLAKIVENQLRDANDRYFGVLRRDKRREVPLEIPTPSQASTAGTNEPVDRGPTPSTLLARREIKEIYAECVQSLSDPDREVILMREFEGADWPAVCEQMGRPNIHATQELYRRASIKLSRLLARRLKGVESAGSSSPTRRGARAPQLPSGRSRTQSWSTCAAAKSVGSSASTSRLAR